MKTTRKHWPQKVNVGRVSVPIYRRKTPQKNWAYMVANYAEGKRRFDSYASEESAMDAALLLARRLSSHDTKAAALTEQQAMEYIRAVEVLGPFKLTVGAAAEALAASLKRVGDMTALNDAVKFYADRHKKTTDKLVSDVVIELLAKWKSRGKSERYLNDIRSRLQNTFAQKFVCNIGSINTAAVQAWLDSMNFESQQTYKNYRTLLHLLFGFAVRRGYAVDNPVTEVERAEIRDTDEVGTYTPEEMAKLLSAASPEFLPCLAISAFAGLRSAEIERLEWADIDLAAKLIKVRVEVAKTASRRFVPMADNLVEWLAPYAGQKGNVWKGSHDGYYQTQQRLSETAKVDWVHNGLRHSYGSYRFAQLYDSGRVAGEMGNSASVVNKHYRELVKPADAVKFFAVKPQAPANVVSLAVMGK
jgi:integrase